MLWCVSRAAAPLAISGGQREVLKTLASSRAAAYWVVQRARVLLLVGDGVSNSEISEVVGVSRPTVLAWRGQFEKDGPSGFGEVARVRARKPSISDEKVAEIVELTLHSKPEGEPALHPHLLVVAQSSRTVVSGPDRQGHPPGRVPQRERPHHRDRGLPESQQR
jgi:hypothetical protein